MNNLANYTLAADVQRPTYDRSALKSRLVHLGFGAFHRAHQALLTDRVLNKLGGDWGYCEINLIGGETLIEQLRQQDHLYSVLEKGASHNQAIVIGAVHESLHATLDGIHAVVEKMAEPQVAIVSLTVTEKGYCIEPGSGRLDLSNPLIKADLAHPQQPASAPGAIVEALRLRCERGLPPFTVLSCDNIPENGHVVKNAVLDLAQARDPQLAAWIADSVTFPSTMVDRIVPAVTEETLTQISAALGVDDPCGIACEPFIQWVVEDNFVAGRPEWEAVGAELVSDVLPYEEMKLRMLNGSHSFLAYLGYLAGYQHINDCMEDSAYRQNAYRLMLLEQAPTLSVSGVDLARYAALLIERYSNPSLKHRTWQIAMDGTQKLPQRMLDSIRWHLAYGSTFPCLALGVAGWMRYVGGTDDAGLAIDVRDPMAETLKQCVANSADGAERVQALLSVSAVFGDVLPQEPRFVEAVSAAYLSLMRQGAARTCAALASQE
ncbi:fructuronate reductase [Edwardsiella ictaluri]|uniref:Mannitol dehydrogenase domain protein n=1 Tax=Edwardsiella ictaluri (strain 93-146) TaxID=634503 RepID=C5BG26_EDWI9|nr:fructuronate reductase [Edwardsiella ictaluri]ACR69749.1 mannitol dehydrogenase domain protein [Edwardsiella ictaluri 93-146]ARD38824.1 fructuronate reductase [Edwardsiella ictaluri]AVZ83287.1 fructuronate reductase [Edwardsiella ictaluri]EKS7761836.1 fructuronate reductase [Edwardsiella ictaluri]EKS7768646.1 fructuronate reductase [Edwardsiella ictaluri]